MNFELVAGCEKVKFGGQSMVSPLQSVLVRSPDSSFGQVNPKKWHYTKRPNLFKARTEHDKFVQNLRKEGVKVYFHEQSLPCHADSIFVHDPAFITNKGAIILKMGKKLRSGEEEAIEKTFKSLGIPILCKLHGEARAEGGDILWINDRTLAIGRGFRTNQEGINQIKKALEPFGICVVQVDLPYDQGKEACLHLQSLISFIDYKKAVVYLKFMPVSFVEYLKKSGIELIEIVESEYPTMAANILAIKPNVVLTINCNPKTIKKLRDCNVKVLTYRGDELSLTAEGGATCLTRPILRQP